ncbi:MAG: indole-3-glycerol phosphate synthase TrpC [Pseudomonadales bacterium]
MSGTILDTIVARKHAEIAERQAQAPLRVLQQRAANAAPTRGFVDALLERVSRGRSAVIAEIKKASPSKGVIRADFDPLAIARAYQAAGAACLSVLTDEHFFQGHDRYLQAARDGVTLPVLRKDFIVDGYQVVESRALGADCLLLIVAALEPARLRDLHGQALSLGLDVLIEVHDAAELDAALTLEPKLVGINNRNLKNFETRLDTTYGLLAAVPDGVLVVTESGIHSRADVAAMHAAGVHAFLVGEALMRAEDPGAALRELFDDC